MARATLSHAPPATECALAIGEFYFTFNFKKNILNYELRFGDFFEIDTRGGARDFQSRRPTPPRAYSESKPNTTRKTENSKTRPYGKKTHKALVSREIAGFANRIQLARPKTAKPAHTAGIKK
ncbi:MAG: hypothetical protein IJ377_04590 [Rikenellaceae bacterium]|nr:hypothetical protein [Rikenellaceae bacterium]